MKQQLEQRLKELRVEFESGQKMLADLENRQTNLKTTLLRMSGAIQVLEELLEKSDGKSGEPLEQSYIKPEEQVRSEAEDVKA